MMSIAAEEDPDLRSKEGLGIDKTLGIQVVKPIVGNDLPLGISPRMSTNTFFQPYASRL